MKDECLAVKISFPGSDLAGANIYLKDWQARELKARVDANNRCLPSILRLRCILEGWKNKHSAFIIGRNRKKIKGEIENVETLPL